MNSDISKTYALLPRVGRSTSQYYVGSVAGAAYLGRKTGKLVLVAWCLRQIDGITLEMIRQHLTTCINHI